MSIGGLDIPIVAPPDVLPAEVILKSMRQLWPDGIYQDAEQEEYYPVNSPRVLVQGAQSREFFVFVNEQAAEEWHRDGATPGNENTMLHFLIGNRHGSRRLPQHITIVCDQLSPTIQSMISDLKMSFRGSRRPAKSA